MSIKQSSLEAFGFKVGQTKLKLNPPLTETAEEEPVLESEDSSSETDDDGISTKEAEMIALSKPIELPKRFKRLPMTDRDIALAVGAKLNEVDRIEFLSARFVPPKNYKFYSTYQGNKTR